MRKTLRCLKIQIIERGFTRQNFPKENLGGFTLLEVMVAIFVITVGVAGAMTILQMTVFLASISSSRLTATYLAQEGIEIVRNVRDTNWLEARTVANDWDEGLTNCSGGCIADYTYSSQLDPILLAYAGQFLNIDGNGFYSYSPDTPTKFQRKIIIQKPNFDRLDVAVQIIWSEKGKPYNFSAQENLYNWR